MKNQTKQRKKGSDRKNRCILLSALAAVLLAAALILATGCGNSSLDTGKIRFGTAGKGAVYNSFGRVFAGILTDEYNGLTIDVKNTEGSAANLRLLSGGYLNLAISQADIMNDAYNGVNSYQGKTQLRGYSAIATLYTEVCQIVVRADSGIKSINDLTGKTVIIGEAESGTALNARQILTAYGLTGSVVKEKQLDYQEAIEQLKSKKIDAIFCTAGIQTEFLENLAKSTKIRFLSIDEQQRGNLKKINTSYIDKTIPAGTYTGQDKAVKTLGVKSVLLASNKLSTHDVKMITGALFNNKKTLQASLPIDLELNPKAAVSGIKIPFHMGAAVYYKEHGIHVRTK